MGHMKRKGKDYFYKQYLVANVKKSQIPNYLIWREEQLVCFSEDKHPESILAVWELIFFLHRLFWNYPLPYLAAEEEATAKNQVINS